MSSSANFTPLPEKYLDPSVSNPKQKFALPALLFFGALLIIINVSLNFINKQPTKKSVTASSMTPTITPITTATTTPTPKPSSKPTLAPTPSLSPTITPTPTPGFKTYTSPVIGNDFYSFQITYPSDWQLADKYSLVDPKGLNVTLVNQYGDIIVITQENGLAGTCVYYDDPDYTNFSGTGLYYISYTQLDKPAPWRISKNKDTSTSFQTVCEKYKDQRYITLTRIGWVGVKSVSSNNAIKSILESIVLKPTAVTKTIFD